MVQNTEKYISNALYSFVQHDKKHGHKEEEKISRLNRRVEVFSRLFQEK